MPPVSAKSAMAYSVNGVSLSAPGVDMLHPAMNYGKFLMIFKITENGFS